MVLKVLDELPGHKTPDKLERKFQRKMDQAVLRAIAECAVGVCYEVETIMEENSDSKLDRLKEELEFLVKLAEDRFQSYYTRHVKKTNADYARKLMNSMLMVYCAAGKTNGITLIYDHLLTSVGPSQETFNTLIWSSGFVERDTTKAINLVGDMQSAGVQPNQGTIDTFVRALVLPVTSAEEKHYKVLEAMGHIVSLCNMYEFRPWEKTLRFIYFLSVELHLEKEFRQMCHDTKLLNKKDVETFMTEIRSSTSYDEYDLLVGTQ